MRRAAYAGEERAIAIVEELDSAIERVMAVRQMYLELLENDPDELAKLELELGVNGKEEVLKAEFPELTIEMIFSLMSAN